MFSSDLADQLQQVGCIKIGGQFILKGNGILFKLRRIDLGDRHAESLELCEGFTFTYRGEGTVQFDGEVCAIGQDFLVLFRQLVPQRQ